MGNMKIYSSPLIFLNSNYFVVIGVEETDRNIWRSPAAQFTVYCSSQINEWKSIDIQAVCRQDVNKIVGTSWRLASKQHQIFYMMKKLRTIFVYLKFHLTMMSALTKIIWRCFLPHFLATMGWGCFSFNICTAVHQSELEYQIWTKIEQKICFYFSKVLNSLMLLPDT